MSNAFEGHMTGVVGGWGGGDWGWGVVGTGWGIGWGVTVGLTGVEGVEEVGWDGDPPLIMIGMGCLTLKTTQAPLINPYPTSQVHSYPLKKEF